MNTESTTSTSTAHRGSGRPVGAVYADREAGHLDILVATMAIVTVLSGIGAGKGVHFGTIPGTSFEIITDGAFFLFPLAYICGDMISELYGPRAALRAVLASFAFSFLAVIFYIILIALPAFPSDFGAEHQAALELVVGPLWQISLAGFAGFLAGQTLNTQVVTRMKARMGERGLLARLFSSSGLGELVDTVIFCTIAAPVLGITTFGQWFSYTLLGLLYKVLVQYALVPVSSAIIRRLKATNPSYQAKLAQLSASGTAA